MNSSDHISGATGGTVELSSNQFEVIFQVTKEVPNLREVHLARADATWEDVDQLLTALRSIRSRTEGAARVLIDLDKEEGLITSGAPSEVARTSAELDVRGRLPRRLASRWESLIGQVILALGQRELFLRTGYELDEIRDAVSRVGGIE